MVGMYEHNFDDDEDGDDNLVSEDQIAKAAPEEEESRAMMRCPVCGKIMTKPIHYGPMMCSCRQYTWQ